VPLDQATDRPWLLALQRDETAALNELIERWQRPLLSFAVRYLQNSADAEDLVAETFVRLYQQRHRLRADTRLSAWLFTTLTNHCHNHHRWRSRHPTISLEAVPGPEQAGSAPGPAIPLADRELAPDATLVHDESLAAVRSAVDALPHDLKVTVLLHHYERLSYREIAAITGCSERGVETRLARARQQLRKGLRGYLREAARD
jgi:RNA polymerase sigma-70 factor (ECF subfamily)